MDGWMDGEREERWEEWKGEGREEEGERKVQVLYMYIVHVHTFVGYL